MNVSVRNGIREVDYYIKISKCHRLILKRYGWEPKRKVKETKQKKI
jgi:hypothetical protein